jgi:prophage maintenance system killer protein
LWFYLGTNEPFIDANKITAYIAMEALLLLNGSSVDELKIAILQLAEDNLKQEDLTKWLKDRVQ